MNEKKTTQNKGKVPSPTLPIYKLAEDVIIEPKNDSLIVFSKPLKSKKIVLKDKTDIEIIDAMSTQKEFYVELMVDKLNVHKNRIKTLMKKLVRRGFLVNCTKECTLEDDEQGSATVTGTGIV